jgi:glutamine synthetase
LPYKVADGKIKPLSFTPKEVMRRLEVDKIKFIDLQFTGLTGRFHHTTVAAKMFRVEDFEIGLPKVDGSSIRGFTEIQESDLIIMPDPSTYATIPWLEKDQTARLICDVIKGDSRNDSFARDPRRIADKAEKYVRKLGYEYSYWGPRS